MGRDLVAARGRAHKLSFFIHNFMDETELACDRIAACVFMVATRDGPISMCLHNARRDSFILQPLRLADGSSWSPATGRTTTEEDDPMPVLTRKTARGRRRLEINHARPGAAT